MTETAQKPPANAGLNEYQHWQEAGGTRGVATREVTANHQYGGAYRSQLEESERTGECIFCQESFQETFLFEARNWGIRHSEYPTTDVEGSHPEHHFLIVPKHHLTEWSEITSRGHKMIARLLKNVRDAYRINGGGLFHRLGDPRWSGGTIRHLHIHFVVPRTKLVDGVPVAIPVNMPIG